jgi:hypothetical protein
VAVLVVAAAIVYIAKRRLHDDIGAYTAYLQNLMMSGLFINLLMHRGTAAGQSPVIAVAKMAGTLASTIIFCMGRVKFFAVTGGLIFTLDIIYLLLLLNQGRLVWPFRLKLRS